MVNGREHLIGRAGKPHASSDPILPPPMDGREGEHSPLERDPRLPVLWQMSTTLSLCISTKEFGGVWSTIPNLRPSSPGVRRVGVGAA